MRNSAIVILEYVTKLSQETQENSCFKTVNTNGANLFRFVEANLPEAIKTTAAYYAFEKSWIEFINNSHDAGATHFRVRILEHNDSIKIQILDNGRGLPPEKETPHYDWKTAVLTVSDKVDEAQATGKKSCGQHLGLSTIAYALEREGGTLGICNRSPKPGAIITITSSNTPCNGDTFLEPRPGKGKNIVDEIFKTIIDQNDSMHERISAIAKSPIHGNTRRLSAKRVLSPISNISDTTAVTTPFFVALPTPLQPRTNINSLFFESRNTNCSFSPDNFFDSTVISEQRSDTNSCGGSGASAFSIRSPVNQP